jgi:hypothetical protein
MGGRILGPLNSNAKVGVGQFTVVDRENIFSYFSLYNELINTTTTPWF